MDEDGVQSLHTRQPELATLHCGCDVPDVREGDACELAAPAEGDGQAADGGEGEVAALLAAGETLVGVGPHAVDGVGGVGLAENVLKDDVDVVVQRVGIPVG